MFRMVATDQSTRTLFPNSDSVRKYLFVKIKKTIMRTIDEIIESSLLVLIIAGTVFGITYLVLDIQQSAQETSEYRIIEKNYILPSSEIGTGVAMSTNGQVGTVITTSSSPEAFILVLRSDSGEVRALKVSPEEYGGVEIGEEVTVQDEVGHITGHIYYSKLKTK